jgi:magnesium transporter
MARRRLRIRKSKRVAPGTSPGIIIIPENAAPPQIYSFHYDEQECIEASSSSFDEIESLLSKYSGKSHWIHIKGFGDKVFFEKLAQRFRLHRLELEDVFNVYQRPKTEEYPGHLFCVSRVLWESENGLNNDQLSLFLIGEDTVLTICDFNYDPFINVKERIRRGKGFLRTQKAGYLAYALMDACIDLFYPLVEKTGERLDHLEDQLIEEPKDEQMNQILEIKRELIMFRRTIWQERDKINDILRSEISHFSPSTRVYFRDAYDHCIQLMDMVDSYKEITSSLMDVYMSGVSNRMNKVITVLTVVSSIFIPLTFIVGVYGMNFSRINPETGEVMKSNMPELYHPYGYVGVWIFMILVAIFQIFVYYKAGWILSGRKKKG